MSTFKQRTISLSDDDIQMCKELVTWWKTGLLDQNGKLMELARTLPHEHRGDPRRAEDRLTDSLVRRVAKL